MKSLKIFLFIIVGIIILVLLAATFAPNNVTITTSITIDAKPKQIYNNVVSLKNWKHWSPFEHDSTMTDKFSGPESGVGSTREWKGKAIGEGKMTVIEATEYTHIKNNLDFGTKGGATGTWTFNQADSTKTHVTWTTHITGLRFPFERLMGLILEPMMKPMFDDGLKDLKEYTETGKVDKSDNKKLKNE